MSATPASPPRVTTTALIDLKRAGRPIAMVTAYDVSSARIADAAGMDAILVGDSLGMTVLGYDSTLPVTMDDMARATAAVSRGTQHALVIADMPFLSHQTSIADALRNAGRLLAECGAQAVKIEGASFETLVVISALVDAGIPVMGHLGLTPQAVNVLGGYRVQARDAAAAARLMDDALALEEAGVFGMVLECIPAELADRVSALLGVPTIGIGAGAGCDGQVQVLHDLLGLGGDHVPRHAKCYEDLGAAMQGALSRYGNEVRDRTFPGAEHATAMSADTLAEAEVLFGAEGDEECAE